MTQDEIQDVARALAKAERLDLDEVCPLEHDDSAECDSSTCIAAHDEDHDAEWARKVMLIKAQAAIAALDAARGKAEPVAWQRRHQYALASDPPGRFYKWEACTYHEATNMFERRPGYEYRPLYAHPPAPDAARGDPVARLIAHIKTIEPDEETAGCPATWADFIQILEGIAEAGEPFNG